MSNSLINKSNAGRLIGSIILFLWIIFNFAMSFWLLLGQRYYAAVGWVIILLTSIFITYLYHIIPRKTLTHKEASQQIIIKPSKEDEEFTILYSTKNNVEVTLIKDALLKNGINCKILGQYSEGMLSFVPDIEVKIMVSTNDFDNSIRILKDIID